MVETRQTTDDNIIRRMRVAWWVSKTTRASVQRHKHERARVRTHQKYLILVASPRQQWSRERASVLRVTYIACLVAVLVVVSVSESGRSRYRSST